MKRDKRDTPKEEEKKEDKKEKEEVKEPAMNYTEFLAAAMDLSLMNNENKLRAAFNFFDENEDGMLNVSEIQCATKACQLSTVQVDKVLNSNRDPSDNSQRQV